MRVDLPDPEGPMIAVNCPRAMSTSTWSRATTRVSPDPYAFTTCRARAATAVRPPVPPCLVMVTADVTVCLLSRSVRVRTDPPYHCAAVRTGPPYGPPCASWMSLLVGEGPGLWCPAQSSAGVNPTPEGRERRPQRRKARLRSVGAPSRPPSVRTLPETC